MAAKKRDYLKRVLSEGKQKIFSRVLILVAVVMSARLVLLATTKFEIDLDVYRLGGYSLTHGLPLYGDNAPSHGLPFTYTPLAAILFIPLSLLSKTPAQVIWTLTLLGFLLLFIHQSVDFAKPGLSRYQSKYKKQALVAGAMALALLLEPIRQNFGLGQINILLVTAILLDLRGKTWKIPAGVLIGIAAAIKLTPLIFVAYLLFTKRFKQSVIAGVTFVVATGVGAALQWNASWEYWTKLAFDASHVGGIPYVANQSTYGVMARLMDGAQHADAFYKPLMLLLGCVGLAMATYAHRKNQEMLGIVLCATTGLLLSPISWSAHWVWVIPALLWFAFHKDAPKFGGIAAIGGFVVFALGSIWWVPREHDVEFNHHGWQLLEANAYFLVAMLFLVATSIRLLQTARSAQMVSVDVVSVDVVHAVNKPQNNQLGTGFPQN